MSRNYLGHKTGLELFEAFDGLSTTIHTLDLRGNELQNLSFEALQALQGQLSHIKIIYLTFAEVQAMTKEKREALNAIFLNLEMPYLCQGFGQPLQLFGAEVKKEPTLTTSRHHQVNLARRFNLTAKLPENDASWLLKNQAGSFFIDALRKKGKADPEIKEEIEKLGNSNIEAPLAALMQKKK